MADDIDIEEHDILENPRIKNILPHINIKTEPVEADDEYEVPIEYDEFNSDEDDNYADNREYEPEGDEYFCHNKIILGSKPCAKPIDHIDSLLFATNPRDPTIFGTSSLRPNPIIFGSNGTMIIGTKSSKTKPERVPEDAFVLLEDWSERLSSSMCYCGECKTLFATENALDAHKMVAHSFLVAMDKEKAEEHPTSPEEDKSKYCNHCHTYFSDDNLLIKHLYEILPNKKLDSNKSNDKLYLQCQVCSCYYSGFARFNFHITTKHGLTNHNTRKVPYNPICSICDRSFNLGNYNKHVHVSHYKIYTKSVKNVNSNVTNKHNVDKVKTPKLVRPVKNVNFNSVVKSASPSYKSKKGVFKCKFCTRIYTSANYLMTHINTTHKKSVKNIRQPFNKTIFPRNILFQCKNCFVHTLTCSVASGHDKFCTKMQTHSWKCPICLKLFRLRDKNMHKLQHKKTDEFRVIVFKSDTHIRVLSKCPTCKVCFEDKSFLEHRKRGCVRNTSALHCNICDVDIKESDFARHKYHHYNSKLTKKDFLYIDDFIIMSSDDKSSLKRVDGGEHKPSLKRNLPVAVPPAKRAKYTLFYCDNCKIFAKSERTKAFHDSNMCTMQSTGRTQCPECGLWFRSGNPYISHKREHDVVKIQLKNITFVSILTLKTIKPPVPDFSVCSQCSMSYVATSETHECKEPSFKCSICEKKFSSDAYKLHTTHYEVFGIQAADKDTEEIISNYESMEHNRNVLYLCTECGLTTDSYNLATVHSREHINNIKGQVTNRCNICDMDFHLTSHKKHAELHLKKKLGRDAFTVIKFNYKDLVSKDRVKIDNVQDEDGLKKVHRIDKFRFYQCDKCRSCSSYKLFLTKHNCLLRNDFRECSKCDYVTTPRNMRNHIQWHTENRHLKRKHIVFVPFNRSVAKVKVEPVEKVIKTEPKIDPSKIIFYQCVKCKSCSPLNAFLQRHNCIVGQNRKCDLCDYVTTFKNMHNHTMWHRDNPNITNDDVVFVPFEKTNNDDSERHEQKKYYHCQLCNVLDTSKYHQCYVTEAVQCPNCDCRVSKKHLRAHLMYHNTCNDFKIVPLNSEKSEQDATDKVSVVYKCRCGLHFTSKKTLDKHSAECGVNMPSENCSKCGLLFPTDLLVSHLCSHYNGQNIVVKDVPVPTVYKCADCQCIFSTKFLYNIHHQRDQCDESKTVKCDKCELTFHEQYLKMHMGTHAEGNDEMSFKICILQKPEMKKQFVLYKCVKCDIHFMSKFSFDLHMGGRGQANLELSVRPCRHCGLRFSSKMINRHCNIHHKTPNSKSFEIITDNCRLPLSTLTSKMPLDEIIKSYIKDRGYHKCWCGVNFLTSRALMYHQVSYKDHSKMRKIKCEKCGQCFSYAANKRHKRTCEYVEVKFKEPLVVNENKEDCITDMLYKCTVCDIHFMKMSSLKQHLQGNHDIEKAECQECRLRFPSDTLLYHAYEQHYKTKLKRADLKIITVEEEKSNRIEMDTALQLETPKRYECFLDKTLYKCMKCNVHFMCLRTGLRHLQKQHDIRRDIKACADCGLRFIKRSLPTHRLRHHTMAQYKKEDITVYDMIKIFCNEGKVIYKCERCGVHFLSSSSFEEHIRDGTHGGPKENCTICGMAFYKATIRKHTNQHSDGVNLPIMTSLTVCDDNIPYVDEINAAETNEVDSIDGHIDSNDVTFDTTLNECDRTDTLDCSDTAMKCKNSPNKSTAREVPSKRDANVSRSTSANSDKNNAKQKLYKCGECNVYFLNQNTCYKHTLNHVPLNPIDYIACKLCDLQFRIMSLPPHIKKHHSDDQFRLDEVLVEEYRPKIKGQKTPKIDIYYAIDKVQSRLVSTTTGDDKVGRSEINRVPAESIVLDSSDTVVDDNHESLPTTFAES